jgi:hypothetical protein
VNLFGSRDGRSGSFEFRPLQSISSTIVDLALIGAIVYLAKIGVREPVVWSILSGVMVGRFGVAHSKSMERQSRGNGGGGGSGGGDSSGPPSWSRRDVPVPVTEERDPRSFPVPPIVPRPATPIPREEPGDHGPPRPPPRARFAAWIASRRALRGPALPWWARRALAVPFTAFRVDAVSLAVVVVLVATLARVVVASP